MRQSGWIWIILAIGVGMPALVLRFSDVHLQPELGVILFGIGILGAASLVSWASEAAEMDISQGLALAFVALIAVLPEYAVDGYLAWQAGQDPSGAYIHYATANMTGANRLLIGIGWSLVVLLFWVRSRRTLTLKKSLNLEIVFLLAATLLAFVIPVFREIALWVAAVLILIFVLYMWLQSRREAEETVLVGPATAIGTLSKGLRRSAVVAFFIFAGLVILISAEPFAEGLIDIGKGLAIDEFFLIQWVAPLASEAPELMIAMLLVMRGNALGGLVILVSAKVNQWTLLVGTLPIIYSVSLGEASGLPLDPRQTQEVLLTAAQSLFAVILLVRMRLGLPEALALFLLFITQLLAPLLEGMHPFFTNAVIRNIRMLYSFIYVALAVGMLVMDRGRITELFRMVRSVFNGTIGQPMDAR